MNDVIGPRWADQQPSWTHVRLKRPAPGE